MTIATGVNKQLKYKVEVTWGTVPAAASAQRLRRVTSTLNLKKRTFESNEILSHVQRVDFRHGVRSVEGAINGELSPGTYKDFMAAAVRRAYTAVTAITALSITISGTGPTYTIARAPAPGSPTASRSARSAPHRGRLQRRQPEQEPRAARGHRAQPHR
jgi:hypothetical protein